MKLLAALCLLLAAAVVKVAGVKYIVVSFLMKYEGLELAALILSHRMVSKSLSSTPMKAKVP